MGRGYQLKKPFQMLLISVYLVTESQTISWLQFVFRMRLMNSESICLCFCLSI
jgi:hypothetical protein